MTPTQHAPKDPNPEDITVYGPGLEESVVGTWFARLGVLAVLIGAAFGYRYAVDQGWIGPTARVLLGAMVGMGFLVGGHASRGRGWYPFASALSGGGIAVLYLATLAAFVRYDLIAAPTALIALSSVALLGGVLAVNYDSLPLSVLATVGAFANPFLIASGEPAAVSALTYVVAVDLGIVYLAYAGRWPVLNNIALVGSTAVFVTVAGRLGTIEGLGFATVLWLIFTVVPFVEVLKDRTKAATTDAAFVVAASTAYFGAGMYLLQDQSSIDRGIFTLGLAVASGVFALVATTDERTRPMLRDVMGVLALAWFTLSGPIATDGPVVSLFWSVEGTVLMWMALRGGDPRLTVLAGTLGLVGLVGAVDHVSGYPPATLFGTADAFVAAAQIASIFALATLLRGARAAGEWPEQVGLVLLGLANLLLLGWLSREVGFEVQRSTAPQRAFASVQFAQSIIWSLYAAILLVVGIARRIGPARYFAIALFAVTILKMVTVDIWELSELYRMVAFVALGALLLVCSLMYNRFRSFLTPPESRAAQGNS